MPIKGVTDNVAASFPMIGVIRKGAPAPRSQNGVVQRPGADLDYFRFTSDYPETLKAFTQTYGAEPHLLNVLLLHDLPEENIESWREDWADGGLLHRCDGETCTIWRQDDGTYSQEPVPCPGPRERVNSKGQKVLETCKPVTRLQLFLPDLRRAGYVLVQSSSINDAINLTAQLKAIAEIHHGSLTGIPMVLSRHGHRISTPGDGGKRVRRMKSLLSLEVSPTWIDLRMAELEAAATPQAVQLTATASPHPDMAALSQGFQPMPPAATLEPDEDEDEAEAEWHDLPDGRGRVNTATGEYMEDAGAVPTTPASAESGRDVSPAAPATPPPAAPRKRSVPPGDSDGVLDPSTGQDDRENAREATPEQRSAIDLAPASVSDPKPTARMWSDYNSYMVKAAGLGIDLEPYMPGAGATKATLEAKAKKLLSAIADAQKAVPA